MQISYWNYKNIKEENREYLLKLPHQVDFECNGIPIHMAHSSVAFVGPYPFSKWNSTLVAQRNMEPGADPKKILADIFNKWDCDSEFQYKEAKVWTEVIIKELSTACEQLYFFLSSVEQYAKKIGDDRRPYALDTWEKAFEKWSDKEIHNLQI